MSSYPINIYTEQYRDSTVKDHKDIDELSRTGAWEELFEFIEANRLNSEYINSSILPVKGENQPPLLYTPLHHAAKIGASKSVFEKLLQLGAAKSLKTTNGETAYDIAKSNELSSDILHLLEIPLEIKQNAQVIEKMEQGLHSVIKGRVEELIQRNGQSLPQLALLFEKGEFYYPVPGMYGGFSVFKRDDGIQADSWIRICGGSEENHFIDREGKVTLLPNDNPI